MLVAKLRHLKNPGAIADDLLARFSLTDAGNRKAATYSGGMRRRLDIAMSLIGNPPIIFLDEPTTGLDPQARHRGVADRQATRRRGTTVLLTTQYLDEAEQLADRIAILHKGTIIQNGTLTELKQLLPPAKVEYVEKQPSLEDVFLALVGDTGETEAPDDRRATARVRQERNSDDHPRPRRHRHPDRPLAAPHPPQPRHDHHHRGHPDRADAAVRLRARRRDRHRIRRVLRQLHAPRHPAHHDRLRRRLHRVPAVPRHAGRHLRTLPVHADRQVERAVGARAHLPGREPGLGRDRHRRRRSSWGSAPEHPWAPGSPSPAS